MKAFNEIVDFFQRDSAGSREEMLAKLAKFIEKRQKARGAGFVSKATNSKSIAKSLETSMMRQQAQKKMTAQVCVAAAGDATARARVCANIAARWGGGGRCGRRKSPRARPRRSSWATLVT